MLGTIIGAIVAGLVIGALGRLILPGKQNISLVMTIVIGVIAIARRDANPWKPLQVPEREWGIQWWFWIVGAILAAVGIVVYGRVSKKSV